MNVECLHLKQEQNYTKSLQGKKIYKDQCVRCFHEPQNQQGLFVCLKCFNGFCRKDLARHLADHNHPLYLNITLTLQNVQQKFQITKLAIGVEGGALGEDQYTTNYRVFCGACDAHILEGDEFLKPQIQSLINTDSPFKKQSLVSWEVEIHPCEHTLTLEQHRVNFNLQNCSNCQLSTNLWLCLTCGNTGCGRKNWDGTGGNGHGIAHFQNTGHPLVVKLGTITAEGDASLYCYVCNNDVKDDLIQQHLIYLGIEIASQKKTEKTVAEINLDLNLNFALSKLIEGKDKSTSVYGSELTGINNIGNTCYLNSVLQSLNALPEFRTQYYTKGQEHRNWCKKVPSECFYCQVSKIFWGLNSGVYSQRKQKKRIVNDIETTQEYQDGIKPYDFKLLIAKDNSQFSSSRQQDALEYLQLFFDKLQKQEQFYGESTTKYFNYEYVNRLVCSGCNGYKAIQNKTNQWKFPVPHPTQQDLKNYYKELEGFDEETRKTKMCEDPEYDVEFSACVELLLNGDSVSANCPKCKAQRIFSSHNYFKSTPKYLLAIPNRFVVQKWVPKKLNALIHIPCDLDISKFLIHNANEVGQFLTDQVKKKTKKKYSEENVRQLESMGFATNAAKRALNQTQDNLQAASIWIMERIDDFSIYLELPEQLYKQDQSQTPIQVDEFALIDIQELGFDKIQATVALLKNRNNKETAIEWLFSVDGDVSSFLHLLNQEKVGTQIQKQYEMPAHSSYQLKAVIIHLGKSVHSGHYVAYVRRGDSWILFNDEKVTATHDPVLGKGYIYVYEGK